MSAENEYNALRTEIENNRKYIFERPIIILAATLFSFKETDLTLFGFGLILGSYVLFFNLWFTANRMRSIARIVAYIRYFHENSTPHKGWENFLHEYRKNNSTNPNRFYPVICAFHIFAILLMQLLGLYVFIRRSIPNYNDTLDLLGLIQLIFVNIKNSDTIILSLIILILTIILIIIFSNKNGSKKITETFRVENEKVRNIYNKYYPIEKHTENISQPTIS